MSSAAAITKLQTTGVTAHSTQPRPARCLTVLGGHEVPEAAYGPLDAAGLVKAWRVLLYGHVGEVDVGVADVLLAGAVPRRGEAGKAAPTGDRQRGAW